MNMNDIELDDVDTDTAEDEIEAVEVEDSEAEDQGDDTDDDTDGDDDEDGEAEEAEGLTVTIGDEPEEEKAPDWVRDLRKQNREQAKRIKELEAGQNAGQQQSTELRKKPTLEDHDYDTAAFEADLEAWAEEKVEHTKRQRELEKEQEAENERWQAKLAALEDGKRALKVNDIDEAEEVIVATFSTMQQGVVVEAAKNPALVFYAIGKNPKKAQELAAIRSPIEFARAIFELEGQLVVKNRKAPPPERRIRGGGSGSAVDNTLDKLREEAARTGDYSKVSAYKAKLRAKG